MRRVLVPRDIWLELDFHLRASAPAEDGAFLLVRPGASADGVRLIAHELILPPEGGWEARGHDRLRPSGQWLSAVVGAAIETDSGLAFIHSHPNSEHPPHLSPVDQRTSIEWSRLLTPSLQRPFLSLVWTEAGVRGWVFESVAPAAHREVDRIDILGGGRIESVGPVREIDDEELDDRQIRALGQLANSKIRQLSVGIVGAGGTGSPLAEQLARMGVRELILVDPDIIETASNLRRVVGSIAEDLATRSAKVDVVARHLAAAGLGTVVRTCRSDVRTEDAARTLLDADVVISTTDTHSSRSFVNQLAHQYLLPTIDVGVKVGTSKRGDVTGMPTDVRVLLPDTGCLWCSGILDSARIRAENLPSDEREQQKREGYIQDVDAPEGSLAALNSFASSLTTLTLLRLLGKGALAPRTVADGWEHFFADFEGAIDPQCICQHWRSMGDEAALAFMPTASQHAAR